MTGDAINVGQEVNIEEQDGEEELSHKINEKRKSLKQLVEVEEEQLESIPNNNEEVEGRKV